MKEFLEIINFYPNFFIGVAFFLGVLTAKVDTSMDNFPRFTRIPVNILMAFVFMITVMIMAKMFSP